MSVNWPIVELGDLVEDLTVGFVGSMTHEYVEKGIPFFRSKNISEYAIDWTDVRYISPEFHSKLKKSSLKPGDVVIVRTGKPGVTCVIPEDISEANCSDVVIARVNNERLSAYYLSYFMNSIANAQVSAHLVGAVQQHFNVGSAKKIKIPLPSRDEQNRIVKILKDLNDKITLNTQTNQTLEQIAQAIFKSWFVDFDPVKAKMTALAAGSSREDAERAAMCAISGKDESLLATMQREQPAAYAELAATAALFPAAMQASELGDVPEGWEVGKLSRICDYPNERIEVSTLTPSNYISTENMLASKGGITDATSLPSVSNVPYYKSGHVLISNIRPYFQKIWLANHEGGRSADVLGFESLDEAHTEYLYNLLYRDEFFDYMMRTSKGVKMPRGDKTALMNYDICIPDAQIRARFSESVRSFYIRMGILNQENKTLAELRDSLLPKLLSGEIDLSNLPDPAEVV